MIADFILFCRYAFKMFLLMGVFLLLLSRKCIAIYKWAVEGIDEFNVNFVLKGL